MQLASLASSFTLRSHGHALKRVMLAIGLFASAACASAASSVSDCPHPAGGGITPQRAVYGVTSDMSLVRFHTCSPSTEKRVAVVSGLQGSDTALVGIDFRVQDGLLYGVGNAGGVYTIDTATAIATRVSQLTTPLSGAHFGVDFNPAANALRIVSDTGQNLRHPFALPEPRTTLVDPALNYTAGTTAAGITAIAYTNNDLSASTGTFLFDIDASLDQLALQAPANNGSLTVAGKLGVDADSAVGFDIHTRLSNGTAVSNVGFATLVVGGVPGFYRIDLTTGAAILLGTTSHAMIDIAVELDQ